MEMISKTYHLKPIPSAASLRSREALCIEKFLNSTPHSAIIGGSIQTPMSIETCIAHAIQSDLDIVEALPEIHDLAMEELEPYIERYIVGVQQALFSVISEKGDVFLRARDAAGLCATCLEGGIGLPPRMLLRMCQTIVQLQTIDAQLVLENEEGSSLYYVKLALA